MCLNFLNIGYIHRIDDMIWLKRNKFGMVIIKINLKTKIPPKSPQNPDHFLILAGG